MSHVASVPKLNITDLKALASACAELGLEFVQNQKTWKWYGTWVNDYAAENAAYKLGIKPEDYGKSEHAIKLPDCSYEIGVVRNNKGELTLAYDFWGEGRKLKAAIGEGCEKLVQHYGVNKAALIARAKGHIMQKQLQPNGDIKVLLTGV